MSLSERSLLILINENQRRRSSKDLSFINAIVCIVDVFGVFPIMALSRNIIICGFYGIIVIVTILILQIYTALLLGKSWLILSEIKSNIALKERCPYSTLADICFGDIFAKFISVLLNVTVFCGGIPNLLVASQNFQLLGLRISNDDFNFSYCYWLIIIGAILCPILCIGSPKDLRIICTLSVALVFLVFVLLCISMTLDQQKNIDESDDGDTFWNLLTVYGILTFQFDIHPTVLTIQMDMKRKNEIKKAILGGFSITLFMTATVTSLAWYKYNSSVKASLLETISPSNYVHFAAIFVSLQLCLSSAIGNSALYETLEESMNIPRDFSKKRCVLRISLVLLGITMAESVPKFDMVMSIIGGTLIGPLVFILPPLFYVKLVYLKSRERDDNIVTTNYHNFLYTRFEVIFCILIIIFGTIATITTTYVNILSAINYTTSSQSCARNITTSIANLF